MSPFSVVFQGTARIRRRQDESTCRCQRKDKHPDLFAPPRRTKRTSVICCSRKGPQPWIIVYTDSTGKQRILGYPRAWNTQVNVPVLRFKPKGSAWLIPAMSQLITLARLDRRKDSLLQRSSLYGSPKNLICSYGC